MEYCPIPSFHALFSRSRNAPSRASIAQHQLATQNGQQGKLNLRPTLRLGCVTRYALTAGLGDDLELELGSCEECICDEGSRAFGGMV